MTPREIELTLEGTALALYHASLALSHPERVSEENKQNLARDLKRRGEAISRELDKFRAASKLAAERRRKKNPRRHTDH